MNVREIIQRDSIKAKKHFGQNFLIDQNILKKIITSSNPTGANVIEIGPGLGSLTEYLLPEAKKLVCYEIDDDMISILHERFDGLDNLTVLKQDFMEVDINKDIDKYFDGEDVILVANLPYYITTAILTKILTETSKVKRIYVMVQKEVAMRLSGKPSTKDYNSLSVFIQYYTNVKMLFNVPPKSFIPAPNVDSSVIEIIRKENLDFVKDEHAFHKFVQAIFSQRRKTLYNNIKNNYKLSKEEIEERLAQNDIEPNRRAESLTVEQIVKLSNYFI